MQFSLPVKAEHSVGSGVQHRLAVQKGSTAKKLSRERQREHLCPCAKGAELPQANAWLLNIISF